MTETWKPIKGYEGLYEVSNYGRVKSLNWNGKGTVGYMTLRKKNTGYLAVLLSKNGVSKYALVHRLVATAFIPNPENEETINHIDEDKTNNRADNLEWCSRTENVRKYKLNHKGFVQRKKKNASAVLQIDKSGNIVNIWNSIASVHNELNYNNWSISQCCENKRKTAYGFIWQYAV